MHASNLTIRRVAGPCCLAAAFAALTCWSWNKWADPLVDFGRELYTPWQLSEGQVLSRDVATLFGPVSQYFNACCFHWFGAGFATLTRCNLVILALFTLLLYSWVAHLCDRATATLACLVQLTIFSFSQYVLEANYNFVAPYAHEATHGLVLNVALIASFSQYLRRERFWWLAASGLCCGLATLTKLEMALTAVTTATCGLILLARCRWQSGRVLTAVLWFVACAVLPIAACGALFLTRLSPQEACAATLGAWRWSGSSASLQQAFYQKVAGLDRPWENLTQLSIVLAGYVGVVALLWLFDRTFSRHVAHARYLPGMLAVATGLAAFCLCPWWDVARPLPLCGSASAAFWTVQSWRGRSPRAPVERAIPFAMWSVAATILLVKTILWTRLMHYGFCLSLPATVMLVMWMLHHIPNHLDQQWGGGRLFRLGAAGLLVAAMLAYWQRSQELYAHKTTLIRTQHDQFYALDPQLDPRVEWVRQALTILQDRLQATDTMAVVPEGAMLNFLTRTVNPTPFISYLPPEMTMFGAARVLASWQQSPPDWVVLWPRDSPEDAFAPFGAQAATGRDLLAWIRQHYERGTAMGTGQKTTVEFLRRREDPLVFKR